MKPIWKVCFKWWHLCFNPFDLNYWEVNIYILHVFDLRLQVTYDIQMAVGYALANSIWLSGPDGVVVVDTTESMEAAREVVHSMRQVIRGPIKGVIYTHSHPDHCFGTEVHCQAMYEMFVHTENQDLSWWQLYFHWWHRRLDIAVTTCGAEWRQRWHYDDSRFAVWPMYLGKSKAATRTALLQSVTIIATLGLDVYRLKNLHQRV